LHFLPVNWDHSHPWFTQKSCHYKMVVQLAGKVCSSVTKECNKQKTHLE
jgi:hypothetical protein